MGNISLFPSGCIKNVVGYIGEIVWFADSIVRKDFILANGQPIDSTLYPELAEYAEVAEWSKNSDGQYLTPDLSGRVLISSSDTHAVGTDGGEEEHTQTLEELASHYHNQILTPGDYPVGWRKLNHSLTGISDYAWNEYISKDEEWYTSYAGGNKAFNIMQPYYVAAAQIRAKVDDVPNAILNVFNNITPIEFTPSSSISVNKIKVYANTNLHILSFEGYVDGSFVGPNALIGTIDYTPLRDTSAYVIGLDYSGNRLLTHFYIYTDGRIVYNAGTKATRLYFTMTTLLI